jgi:serine/threonine protein kinase
MDAELETVARKIESARCPEDAFGALMGQPDEKFRAARLIFYRLSKVIHPDRYITSDDRELAHRTMTRLNALWGQAQDKIATGWYGKGQAAAFSPYTKVLVQTRKRVYEVGPLLETGDICTLYSCCFEIDGLQHRGLFKIARTPEDNHLVATEAHVLRHLRTGQDLQRLFPFVPEVHDSFLYQDGVDAPRHANVLEWSDGLYSLAEVRASYSRGLDPRDVAWMWRKLLIVLGFAHAQDVIHGAVLPSHIFIQPEQHGLVLNNWLYAVRDPDTTGECIRTIVAAYGHWYPPEVYAKQLPTPGLDIYMGARCVVYLMGGDPLTGELPDSVPLALRAFFRGCLMQTPAYRSQNAWALLDEFTHLIEQLWGPRTFRPFAMPAR